MTKSKSKSVKINPETYTEIVRLANETNRTIDGMISWIVKSYNKKKEVGL